MSEKDPTERTRLALQVVEAIRIGGVHELLAILESGTLEEKRAAMRILGELSDVKDPRLGQDERERWLSIARRMVDAEYPRPGISGLAFHTLYRNDFESAVDALTRTLDLRRASDVDHATLVTHLGDLATRGATRALERLGDMRAFGGPAGDAAGAMLDRFDPEKKRQRMEELAREWREKRTPSLLADLYHGPLGALLVRGTTRRDLIALLGPPDEKQKGMIWYQPSDATALSIEFDEKGKAIGWHMT